MTRPGVRPVYIGCHRHSCFAETELLKAFAGLRCYDFASSLVAVVG